VQTHRRVSSSVLARVNSIISEPHAIENHVVCSVPLGFIPIAVMQRCGMQPESEEAFVKERASSAGANTVPALPASWRSVSGNPEGTVYTILTFSLVTKQAVSSFQWRHPTWAHFCKVLNFLSERHDVSISSTLCCTTRRTPYRRCEPHFNSLRSLLKANACIRVRGKGSPIRFDQKPSGLDDRMVTPSFLQI